MTERLLARLEQKTLTGDGPGEISGLASTYNTVDLQDDAVQPGAFDKTIQGWAGARNRPPLLDWHGDSISRLIGSVVELKSTPLGLWFRALFSADPAAQAARRKAQEGHLTGVSIGYLPVRQTFQQLGDRTVRLLHEVRLLEISLTPVPANPEARLASVKSASSPGEAVTVGEVLDDLEWLETWERGEQAAAGLYGLATASVGQLEHLVSVKVASDAAELGRWAASPEVAALAVRDPDRERADRERARRARRNAYSSGLAEWQAAPVCGVCWRCQAGGRCIHA